MTDFDETWQDGRPLLKNCAHQVGVHHHPVGQHHGAGLVLCVGDSLCPITEDISRPILMKLGRMVARNIGMVAQKVGVCHHPVGRHHGAGLVLCVGDSLSPLTKDSCPHPLADFDAT